jgi:hypothetical protein
VFSVWWELNFQRHYYRINILKGWGPGQRNRYSDWLWAGRPRGRSWVPGQEFSLLQIVQTGSGVHLTSYKMGTGGSFPGVKRPESESDHSPPTSAEIKKKWIYTSTSPYVFTGTTLPFTLF